MFRMGLGVLVESVTPAGERVFRNRTSKTPWFTRTTPQESPVWYFSHQRRGGAHATGLASNVVPMKRKSK